MVEEPCAWERPLCLSTLHTPLSSEGLGEWCLKRRNRILSSLYYEIRLATRGMRLGSCRRSARLRPGGQQTDEIAQHGWRHARLHGGSGAAVRAM